eukprot:GHVS01049316.1.p1 GENE.GHVS01049316.1~~GHVS01049316.1.p1  ORF type:complete len:618 (-),score=80.25 GHVS01049316.1:230-2083(-)
MLVVLVEGVKATVFINSIKNASPVEMAYSKFLAEKPNAPYFVKITDFGAENQTKDGHNASPSSSLTVVEPVDTKGVALFFFHGLRQKSPKWQGQIAVYLQSLNVKKLPVYLWVPDYHQATRRGFSKAAEQVAVSFAKAIEFFQKQLAKIDCLFFCHSLGCLALFDLLLPRAGADSVDGDDGDGDVDSDDGDDYVDGGGQIDTWPANQLCLKKGSLALKQISMKGGPFLGWSSENQFFKFGRIAGVLSAITSYGGVIDDLRLANNNLKNLWNRLKKNLDEQGCTIFGKKGGLLEKGGLNLFGASGDEVVDLQSSLVAPYGFSKSTKAVELVEPIEHIVEPKNISRNRLELGEVLFAAFKTLGVRRYTVDFGSSGKTEGDDDARFFPIVLETSPLNKAFANEVVSGLKKLKTDSKKITAEQAIEVANKQALEKIKQRRAHSKDNVQDNVKKLVLALFALTRGPKGKKNSHPHSLLIGHGRGKTVENLNGADAVLDEMGKFELMAYHKQWPDFQAHTTAPTGREAGRISAWFCSASGRSECAHEDEIDGIGTDGIDATAGAPVGISPADALTTVDQDQLDSSTCSIPVNVWEQFVDAASDCNISEDLKNLLQAAKSEDSG